MAWFGAFSPTERDRPWTSPPRNTRHGGIPCQATTAAAAPARLCRMLHFDQTSCLPHNLREQMDAPAAGRENHYTILWSLLASETIQRELF